MNQNIIDAHLDEVDDEVDVDTIEEAYEGQFDNEADNGQNLVDNGFFGHIDDFLMSYIDFKSLGRDCLMDKAIVEVYGNIHVFGY